MKPNLHRVYVALAAVAVATLAACILLTVDMSERIRASERSGEVWSARLERYERLERMTPSLEAFNLAVAEAVGELLLAPPSAETASVLGELRDIDGAMTEGGQVDFVREALAAEFSDLRTHLRAIQERHLGAVRTDEAFRRLANNVLTGAALFLILGALFYGCRLAGRQPLWSEGTVVPAP